MPLTYFRISSSDLACPGQVIAQGFGTPGTKHRFHQFVCGVCLDLLRFAGFEAVEEVLIALRVGKDRGGEQVSCILVPIVSVLRGQLLVDIGMVFGVQGGDVLRIKDGQDLLVHHRLVVLEESF